MNYFKKLKFVSTNQGMTYVELIVVLGIFAVMSSVAIFNYGSFQSRVDMRNLANDVALKIVEAQKAAMGGKFPSSTSVQYSLISDPDTWKPTYGTYFKPNPSNKSFVYFIDVGDGGNQYNGPAPGSGTCNIECIENINITKGNFISELEVFYSDNTSTLEDELSLSFTRPNSGAIIVDGGGDVLSNVSYVQITITSPKSDHSYIKLYSSGRVQID